MTPRRRGSVSESRPSDQGLEPFDREQVVSVILAAGRGTRMGCRDTHKVCFPVGGVPFILRVLKAYERAGVHHHVVVVGAQAEQVISTVLPHFPHVVLAYQPEPLGTGHATRCGVALLRAVHFAGTILVAMGDRLVAPEVVRRLVAAQQTSGSDVALLVGSLAENLSSGRVLSDSEGNVRAIVEKSEIALSALVRELEQHVGIGEQAVDSRDIRSKIARYFPDAHKAQRACAVLLAATERSSTLASAQLRALLGRLKSNSTIVWREHGKRCAVAAAEANNLTDLANLGCYAFRANVLFRGLDSLERNNAQGEEYLTDVIKALALMRRENGTPLHRIVAVRVVDGSDALTFNTPQELAEVERRVSIRGRHVGWSAKRPQLSGSNLRTVGEWHSIFACQARRLRAFMESTYGPDEDLHRAKCSEYLHALAGYAQAYGSDDKVFLIRSPGRLNLMGRHVDHRGGHTNVVAISEEVLLVCHSREDDILRLRNASSERFAPAEFSLGTEARGLSMSNWDKVLSSARTLALTGSRHWANYFKAAALRLQAHFPDFQLHGLDVFAHGTIPMGSGLSSSSALVVAASEALIVANGLPVHPNLQVDLCGEGEWFVGTRGGAGDHAAIKFGRRGQVVQLGFLPFRVCATVPFFEDHVIVVANSGIEARKSEEAREAFNSRILSYTLGEVIYKRAHPELAPRIQHLRDINPESLGLSLRDFYASIKDVPLTIAWREMSANYGPFTEDERQRLEAILDTLQAPQGPFPVRGVLLFGVAECERSRRCVEYLRQQDADGFGMLWYVSHDGDRVVGRDQRPWRLPVDDTALDNLARRADSRDWRALSRAQLIMQPGVYRCSTPELDRIVDLVRTLPGVKGAQMAGAGLGGCVMVLVEEAEAVRVISALTQAGFESRVYGLVEGAGIVAV